MYEKRYGEAKFNQSPGKPTLIYESKLVNSYEPTGVPVSSHIKSKHNPDPDLTFCRTVSRSLAAQERRNEQQLRQALHMGIDKTLDYGSICVSYSHT
jgi:hypothetical protein